mgnify:CR=1 FL=1
MAPVQNLSKDGSIRCFQDLILTLQRFWAARGCAILQPYDMEVGAGTLHPATTLRALGPKPWRAAYVQPSRRPKDGRYGENPNRLGHYYQFQVILKPNPPDIQNLYLESLVELGIDPLLLDRIVSGKAGFECDQALSNGQQLDDRRPRVDEILERVRDL